METFWQNHRLSIVALAALAVALMSSIVIVPETQQAVEIGRAHV